MELRREVGRELPGRGGPRAKDVDLGVFGREEVVVAWLAADAARRIGHVGGGHGGVDDGRM